MSSLKKYIIVAFSYVFLRDFRPCTSILLSNMVDNNNGKSYVSIESRKPGMEGQQKKVLWEEKVIIRKIYTR